MTNWKITSPRIAALRILEQRFGEPDTVLSDDDPLPETASAATWKLADWQADAVARAERILRRRGGVLIADSVGLGKTHIGAALIERARARGLRCAVIAPTALRQQWRRTLRNAVFANINGNGTACVRLLTHAQLGHSHGPALIEDAQFIVVDEAHAFRTRNTNRYQALHAVRGHAEFVLLSATPVNNSATDLLNLLLLFARDDAFRDIGVPALGSVFRGGDTQAIARVLAETTIRRTRAFVRRNYSAIVDRRGHTLRFPEREDPVVIRYDLAAAYGDAWPAALDTVQDLEFAWLDPGTRELLRLNLLKRFESSTHALVTSLESLGGFVDAMLDALRDGHALSPADYYRLFGGMKDQLVMPAVLLSNLRREPDAAAVARDRERIRKFAVSLSAAADPKLDALRDVLARVTTDAPAVVFASFRDTARHLWRAFRNEFRIALIDGQDARLGAARASRTAILRALAPGARVHARERVDVLIATDVLSEGLDLHAARTVVSYDLPWNPIRIVQRVGRIDRPGSPHETIRIVNFLPDHGLDRLLDLLHRIRTKLDTIRGTVGLDAPVIDRSDVDAHSLTTVLGCLAVGDARVLDDDSDDVTAINETLYREWKYARGELQRCCGESGSCGGEANIVAALDSRVSVLARAGRVFVIGGLGVTEDWVAASKVLLRAFTEQHVGDIEQRHVQSTLRRVLRAGAAGEAASPTNGLAARATRLVLAVAPQFAGPSDLVRAEAVLRKLRLPMPRHADRALEQLLSDPPTGANELLDHLEAAVLTQASEPATEPWVLLLGQVRP